jgi:hypothetical protein
VYVRRVDSAGLEEADSGADTKAGKDGEFLDVLEQELV